MNTMVTHVVAEAADADILNKILKFKYVKDDIYYIIVGVCGSVRPSVHNVTLHTIDRRR